jgi:hypothetical protein
MPDCLAVQRVMGEPCSTPYLASFPVSGEIYRDFLDRQAHPAATGGISAVFSIT